MTLTQWAQRHGVSREALQELVQYVAPPVKVEQGQSEAAVTAAIRLEASRVGCRLWRNNNIACKDESGRMVRAGLMNESAQMNKTIKSSDLIGITPVLVTPDMIGRTLGVFTAVEVKRADWVFNPNDEHCSAQFRFGALVQQLGAFFTFANDNTHLNRMFENEKITIAKVFK